MITNQDNLHQTHHNNLSKSAIRDKILAQQINVFVKDKPLLHSLEFFAGAGGIALGVHRAGFTHLGLIELDNFAVATLRDNSESVLQLNPELVIGMDAKLVDYSPFIDKVDLLSGGPPCQPFSNGGKNAGADDPRNAFPIILDAVGKILPKAILIENVKGLLRKKFSSYFDYLLVRLKFPLCFQLENESWENHYLRLIKLSETDFNDDEQYLVNYQLLNTADYGIPQRRERVIITAFRRDLGIDTFSLVPTHSKESLLIDQWITSNYWFRHGIAPVNFLGKQATLLLNTLQRQSPDAYENKLMPWRTIRDAIYDLPNPVLRGEIEEIPNHVQHPGARIYNGHIGSYYDYPAKALKAGTHGTPGGENILRVTTDGSQVRYFTTREAARLHTFPDEWKFHGTWGACIKQLGNALPVDIAKLFAEEIKKRLLAIIK